MGGEVIVIIFVVLLVVAVAYISIKSPKNKEDEPKKATANLLAEGMVDVFIRHHIGRNFKKARDSADNFASLPITATDEEIYLCLASLWAMSFTRAIDSNVQIPEKVKVSLCGEVLLSLQRRYVELCNNSDEETFLANLDEMNRRFTTIWNESVDKNLIPHIQLGKEVSRILTGGNQDGVLVIMYGELFSSFTQVDTNTTLSFRNS